MRARFLSPLVFLAFLTFLVTLSLPLRAAPTKGPRESPSPKGILAMNRNGFMLVDPAALGGETGPSNPLFTRAAPVISDEARNYVASIQRGEVTGDMEQVTRQLGVTLAEFQRAITSNMSGFPVRENLEAEARILLPLDTPVRNMLPRVPGAGKAAAWKQLTSLGGKSGRMFFSETGAPKEKTSVYGDRSSSYKLLGQMGSVTGFAMATGANFQNQYGTEKALAMQNLMICEEYALIKADSTSIAEPWGDGTSALAFDGMWNLITTGNGTPSAQIQTAVGALTLAHINLQLAALYKQGAKALYMLMNEQECRSLAALAAGSGSVIRVQAAAADGVVLGVRVVGYVHPVTGETVAILPCRDLMPGEIIFGAASLPNGGNVFEVEVLPQVQLPQLAAGEQIQGYTAQEIAPAATSPQVFPFIITVYETLKLKSGLHVAKSSGVTPAAGA